MEKFKLADNLRVFGKQVTTFPAGIKEAFDHLVAIVPNGNKRSYYGLSRMADNGKILYYAAVEEAHNGEGGIYGLDTYTIPEGEYSVVAIRDWMKKTDSIKDVFHEMLQSCDLDLSTYCVEWYKSDDEMLCMIKNK